MILSWENLVEDGQTDRQTDESDFIGRCPTNDECPTSIKAFHLLFIVLITIMDSQLTFACSSQQYQQLKKVWNMFKVKNKNTRTS